MRDIFISAAVLFVAIGCTDPAETNPTTSTSETGAGAGTSSAGGMGGAGAGSQGGGGSAGVGGEAPTGAPLFVAHGHFARTTVSCDDGQSWVANQSSDDAARCWSNNNLPDCDHAAGSARGITYGDGWFVATFGWGEQGEIRRSQDGVVWEPVTSETTFAGVAYGNGVFMAGSSAPSRSTDGGATWTELDYVVNENVRRTGFVDAAGGLFVMASDGPLVFSDDDGDTWWEPTQLPNGCGHNIMFSGGIAYGNDTLVVLNGDGLACRSTDGGQTFTSADLGANVSSDLIFDGAKFMAWSYGNLHESSDGESWTTTPLTQSIEIGPVAQSSDGTLVAVNGGWQVWYEQQAYFRSADGITWEALPGTAFVGSHPIFDIAFGHGIAPAACAP